MQTHFGIPIRLLLFSEITVEDKKQQLLNQGKIISLDHETDQWRFIAKISDSRYAIKMGPIKQPITSLALLSVIVCSLFFFLAIALFLWFRPLWRSIKELIQAADSFGSGALQTRANIKQSAVLGKLASQFNTMAHRISGKIGSSLVF